MNHHNNKNIALAAVRSILYLLFFVPSNTNYHHHFTSSLQLPLPLSLQLPLQLQLPSQTHPLHCHRIHMNDAFQSVSYSNANTISNDSRSRYRSRLLVTLHSSSSSSSSGSNNNVNVDVDVNNSSNSNNNKNSNNNVPATSLNTNTNTNTNIKDIISIAKHVAFSLVVSLVLSLYEGYDCSYLKPLPATIRQFPPSTLSGSTPPTGIIQDTIQLMKSGTRGMGRGEIDRMDGWFQNTYFGDYDPTIQTATSTSASTSTSAVEIDTTTIIAGEEEIIIQSPSPTMTSLANINALRNIKSYNEVMKYHREYRVQNWKDDTIITTPTTPTTTATATATDTLTIDENNINKIKKATHGIYDTIRQIEVLKSLANEYEWEQMDALLSTDIFKKELEMNCNILRSSIGYIDYDSRQEIGFDWGSCAWRHCGAQADAQESLAELYNSLGLYEPYECLFTIDIIERSLRDIITVIPMKYQSIDDDVKMLLPYVPYQSQQELNDEMNRNNDEEGDDNDIETSDLKFLDVLSSLRNVYNYDD